MLSNLTKNPSLSAIIPCYNHGKYLPTALDAIINQSVVPEAIYVIDDASTDNTSAVIKKYAQLCPNIVPIFQDKNLGCNASVNRALALVNTEYVFFCAADDYILPHMLKQTLSLLKQHQQAGLCSGLCYIEKRNLWRRQKPASPRISAKKGFVSAQKAQDFFSKNGSWFWGATTIFKVSSVLKHGGFDPELDGFADSALSMMIALQEGCCFVPEYLAVWTKDENSMASRSQKDLDFSIFAVDKIEKMVTSSFEGAIARKLLRGYILRWACSILVHGSGKEALNSKKFQNKIVSYSGSALIGLLIVQKIIPKPLKRFSYFLILRWRELPRVVGRRILHVELRI
jgi:glycosyltransferase involved in cell wall biosynthesis